MRHKPIAWTFALFGLRLGLCIVDWETEIAQGGERGRVGSQDRFVVRAAAPRFHCTKYYRAPYSQKITPGTPKKLFKKLA
jgi:hypothetical protein